MPKREKERNRRSQYALERRLGDSNRAVVLVFVGRCVAYPGLDHCRRLAAPHAGFFAVAPAHRLTMLNSIRESRLSMAIVAFRVTCFRVLSGSVNMPEVSPHRVQGGVRLRIAPAP